MKWFTANLGTIVMALLLSLLTWTLLYSEKTNTLSANAVFEPVVRAEVGSLRYAIVGGGDLRRGDKFSVEVTGPRAQLEAIVRNLACAPVLDEATIPQDRLGEFVMEVSRKDFGLPDTVSVQSLRLRVSYARFETVTLPVKAGLGDIEDRPKTGFRVERLRVEPPQIRVRLPANRTQDVRELPIRPIRVTGRAEPFPIRGIINTDALGIEIKSPQEFTIEVMINPVPFPRELSGIPLRLSAPPSADREVELLNPRTIKVMLEGPEELVNAVLPEHLHAYVRLDLKPDVEPGRYLQQVRCDLVTDEIRGQVRVVPMPDEKPENRQATVVVKKKP